MKYRIHSFISTVAMVSAAFVLAGCSTTNTGGGGGGGGGGGENDADWSGPLSLYATDAEETAVAALDGGETLHAYNEIMSSALMVGGAGGGVESGEDPDFSIRRNTDGDIVVSVNGVETTFTDTHNEGWGYKQEAGAPGDPEYTLYAHSAGTVDAVLDEDHPNYTESHHQMWRYWWYPGSGEASTVGYGIVGTETTSSALEARASAADPTATYTGWAAADVAQTADENQRGQIAGDLTLSANFGTAKISGVIDNLEKDPFGTPDPITGGEIQLVETDISTTNGFFGDVTANQTTIDEFGGGASEGDVLGTYGGKFYGPDAGEVAGVFSIDQDDVVAAGAFSATEQ